ncbi:MAG: discoidin domain-containing protein [Pirellulales bacterium]|nr:discoidin domain-containing protein [Pirellulales bacterium]
MNATTRIKSALSILMAAVLTCCSYATTAESASRPNNLEIGFHNPPHSAGIRAFWWWLNGNVTKEAITRDLEEMKEKGYNGALIFDADGSDQRGNRPTPAGPLFGSPQWMELFVHACREAKRLGLELSLNIQSGWNLGGPKVTPEEATQTLVWSKTEVKGPAKIKKMLKKPRIPERNEGFYRDIAVIAVPLGNVNGGTQSEKNTSITCSIQASSSPPDYPAVMAMDGNQKTFWVSEKRPDENHPQWLLLKLSKPTNISKLSLLGRKGYGPRECVIQVSLDNKTFHTVKEASLKDGEMLEASFQPRQAKFVRLLFTDAYDTNPVAGKPRNVQVTEIKLPGTGIVPRPGVMSRPIKDLSLKSATRELGMSAPDCRFLLNTAPALPGELAVKSSDILDISAKMDKDGLLRWDVPKGEWAVLRIGHTATGAHVSTQSAGWSGRVLDYLNPDSLDAYWNRNIDPLFKAIGPMAGTTMCYVQTDSWEGGGMNWTPGFDRIFRKSRGYDPIPWLAVLAGYVVDSREDSNAFLADFRKTIGDLVAGHYGRLAELSKKYGMATHPECSGPHAGPLDGLKNYGRSELMMSEFWSPAPHRPTPPNRFFVKQASSAAHTYGKQLVGAEGFTTIGPHWNDSPSMHMKPSFDHEICSGLNLLFNHTFTCSPKETGMPGQEYFAGTHFNPQITWWDEAPAVIDYFRRCQYLTQQGRFVADVLYYYGDHIPNIATLKQSDPAGALPGFDYDVLSEELLLCGLAVKKGRLVLPSGMEYRVLVLPDHRVLSLGALKKVDQLVRAGATVLGPKPLKAVSLEGGPQGKQLFQKLADGLWGPGEQAKTAKGSRNVGQGRVAWGMTARDFLLADGVAPDVTFEDASQASGMDWIHYRIGDADVYFLCEQSGKAGNVTAIFRPAGRIPELWDAVDGSIREAATFSFAGGHTHLPLKFDPYDSILVVFRKAASGDRDNGPNFPTWKEKQPISGPWRVTFDTKWGGPDQPVRFDTLTSWTDHDDPRIKYYSGKAVYSTTFDIADDPTGKPLAIELGQVKDVGIAGIKLNGNDLGVVWRAPFRVNIAKAVQKGQNKLEVTVVNSWRNRLIGDEKLPKEKRLTRTNINVTKDWKLETSGLMGSVRVVEKIKRDHTKREAQARESDIFPGFPIFIGCHWLLVSQCFGSGD